MAIIGIDFDGTVVTHDFPKIGKDIGAVPVLRNHPLLLRKQKDITKVIFPLYV